MDNKHLGEIHVRFDRLEEKLDKYAEQTVKNSQDINWIRGTIKLGGSALIALAGAVVAWFLNMVK